MVICVIHDGPREHALVLTSVVNALLRKHRQANVVVLTSERNEIFFRFMPSVTVNPLEPKILQQEFDLRINYGGSVLADRLCASIKCKKALGVVYQTISLTETREEIRAGYEAQQVLYGNQHTRGNIFQIMYRLAGLKWKGEGYAFRYFPRAREKDNRIGYAVRNEELRDDLKKHLKVDDERLWRIPLREDVLKQLTRSIALPVWSQMILWLCMWAFVLENTVELLVYEPPQMRPEFFGKGCIHLVPEEFINRVSE